MTKFGEYFTYNVIHMAKFDRKRPARSQNFFMGTKEDWPLVRFMFEAPSEMQFGFLDVLTNITYHLSNGNLKDVSILDLVAFGSPISTFDSNAQQEWKTQANYEAFKQVAKVWTTYSKSLMQSKKVCN